MSKVPARQPGKNEKSRSNSNSTSISKSASGSGSGSGSSASTSGSIPMSGLSGSTDKSLSGSSGSGSDSSAAMLVSAQALRSHMKQRIHNQHSLDWSNFQNNKISLIDDILGKQIPDLMNQLIEVHSRKLTLELREKNVLRAREIIEKHFLVPRNEDEIELLRNWYLSLSPATSIGKEFPAEFDYNGIYLTTGIVPQNKVLESALKELAIITRKFVKCLRSLLFAFMLLRPEKSHSDNVGVEIQHDVESELNVLLSMFEKDSVNYSLYKLEEERCKFYKSIWQNPQSFDLRRDFIEFECSNFDLIKFEIYESWVEMNVKLEFVRINLDKIKNPRHDARTHSKIMV